MSVIRPTSTTGAATGAFKFLTAMGLFIGQSTDFMSYLTSLATAADAAVRGMWQSCAVENSGEHNHRHSRGTWVNRRSPPHFRFRRLNRQLLFIHRNSSGRHMQVKRAGMSLGLVIAVATVAQTLPSTAQFMEAMTEHGTHGSRDGSRADEWKCRP